jgi:UDP-glucose 4-epimerase
MKTLVTGGAGFIGSHIVEALYADGHDVHVLDNLSTGRRENVPSQVPLHNYDIRSQDAADLMAEQRYEVLIHHAAQLDVRASVADPRHDADINVGGFLNLMEAGRHAGLQQVVFASTGGAIYGEPEYVPQDEHHPQNPISPYGITKLATEKYLHYYAHQFDIQVICLRYANVYGPRQNAHGDAGVVAIFTRQMLEGLSPTINGAGTQTRDYVFVGDVVRANLMALAHNGTGIFNVGTGHESSVQQLFDTLNEIIGPGLSCRYGPSKPGEQQRSVLSHDRAQSILGWTPQTSLREGLAETVEWFRSAHPGLCPVIRAQV